MTLTLVMSAPTAESLEPLEDVDEAELWARARRDEDARRELARRYFPFVREVVRSFVRARKIPARYPLDELVSAGAFRMLGAIRRFEPWRGWKFTTYAARVIRGAVLDELRAMNRAEALTTVDLAWEWDAGDGPAESEGPQPEAPDLFGPFVERTSAKEVVARLWPQLSRRERHILRLSFFDDLSLDEVAATLGLSTQHTWLERTRILDRLRELIAEEGLDG